MSLTTTAPLSSHPHSSTAAHNYASRPSTSGSNSMSYQAGEDRPPYGSYYERPPTSSHGHNQSGAMPEQSSPERLHSSAGVYLKSEPRQSPSNHVYPPPDISSGPGSGPPPSSSHGYPSSHPITPISGSSAYPPPPPPGGYYGLAGQPQEQIPSPPPTGSGRPKSANYTPDGVPIVPVGISGGKMFQCRGFGDCDKVFTRSEHLARHVRKHTGERPFPCHCGKAFSRLDNLRQHAATVHADQAALNESMLASLATVHAALSQRAGREQRKRGEVVEVPKNAVERPRHSEINLRGQRGTSQTSVSNSPYHVYPSGEWTVPQHPRPRTGGGWDYQYPPGTEGAGAGPSTAASIGPVEDAGPSRRPGSSTEYYQASYYDQPPPTSSSGRHPPAGPGTASSTDSIGQLPYPYRPMSSSGRELPIPSHYAGSEPPSTAHGPPPPHSPMYPPGVTHANWSSPPNHSTYPPTDSTMYPPPIPAASSYHPEPAPGYGPAPPGSSGTGYYSYPPPGHGPAYFPPGQQFGSAPPPHGSSAYPPSYGGPTSSSAPESPFSYGPPQQQGPYPYSNPEYDSRKRRADEHQEEARKLHRPSSAVPLSVPGQEVPPQHLNAALQPDRQEPNWLPPTSERRSSLAISALLGSPQQNVRSRPSTADVSQLHQQQTYGPSGGSANGNNSAPGSTSFAYAAVVDESTVSSMPPTPNANGTPRRVVTEDTTTINSSTSGSDKEQKPKALVGSGQ